MARQPRLTVAGEAHLLLQTGHNRQPVFLDADDQAHYLADLREVSRAHGVAVHAYVLLSDRVCLLVTPAEAGSLSRAMQALGRRHVPWHNQRHQRSGTLWEGRFRTCVVESPARLLAAMCHVERLPLEPGMAPDLLAHACSSAAHHLGRRRDPLVTDPAPYWALGNTPFDREAQYQHLLAQEPRAEDTRQIEAALLKGGVWGSEAFVARLQVQIDRPLTARPRGRPRKTAGVAAD